MSMIKPMPVRSSQSSMRRQQKGHLPNNVPRSLSHDGSTFKTSKSCHVLFL